MTHDDAGEDALAGIDLHKWQVPPPPDQPPSILARALASAPVSRRRRIGWALAGMAILNAALVAIIAIIISRPPSGPIVSSRAAGGPADDRTQELLRQLDEQQREIDRRLAELQELRALVDQLSEKLRTVQQRDKSRPLPKPRDPLPPSRDPVSPSRDPLPPSDPAPARLGCDEVSCVLDNYASACCARYRQPPAKAPVLGPTLPDSLDRAMISTGIAAVRARISACGNRSFAKGKVKVRVQVDSSGSVTSVSVESTPDPELAACVAATISRTRFGQTKSGGSFSYPFIF